MKHKFIFIVIILLTATSMVYAIDSIKPDTHDTLWLKNHGIESRINESECLLCHTERTDCIKCHQEIQPRNHTLSWIRRVHRLESSWNRDTCVTCHREDSCTECHLRLNVQ